MAISPERSSEFAMTYHPTRNDTAKGCHGGKYHRDDDNLPTGMDGKRRHINADVVATIGYGHEGNTGYVSMMVQSFAGFRLRAIVP